MTRPLTRRIVLPTLALVALASGTLLQGFVDSGRRWVTASVLYYVNPQSIWVSPSVATSAVQMAAAGWRDQTQANIELVYAGTTTGSALTLNYRNEVFFRNGSNGSFVAETYSYWNGSGQMLDSDIVFYEGAFKFFSGSGCVSGIYIENVAIHEFGHLLGLRHTTVSGATMAPSMPGYCDRTWLTLASDDITGLESMYPPAGSARPAAPTQLTVATSAVSPTSSLVLAWTDNANNELGARIERSSNGSAFAQVAQVGANVTSFTNTGLTSGTTYSYRVYAYNGDGASSYSNTATGQTTVSVNTAPAVSIANPVANASYPEGASITFSGSAIDGQDGDLSASLKWTSNLAGQIGTGASFSRTLAAGSHVIAATATDSGALTGTAQVTLTVTVGGPSLTARGYKVKGRQMAELRWTGITAATVDVFRNGSRVATPANSGLYTDQLNATGGGSYAYKVCAAGGSLCTNVSTVVF